MAVSRCDRLFARGPRMALLRYHGRSIAWAQAGQETTVVAAWVEDDQREAPADDGRGLERRATCHVSDDAAAGIASPLMAARATVDGETWELIEIVGRAGGLWETRFAFRGRSEISTSGYRRRRFP